jgi:hypothetical protein
MRRSRSIWVMAAVLATAAVAPRAATAETLAVGVFAPSAPFESTAARVDLATKLAAALGTAVDADGVGKVYGRAGDFAAAVKKGEIQVAVVDATYLATAGTAGGTVVAISTRDGDASRPWQLVARGGAADVLALKGKKLLVPSVGGREVDFVLNAQLGGELGKGFFASIASTPDTASTLAALGLGKADAAVVPADAALPTGVVRVATLPVVPGPVLVVYGGASADRRAALATAAAAFRGDAVITGFRADDGDAVRALGKRFTLHPRRGPMAVPSVRIVVGELVADRALAITPGDPARYAAPVAMPVPGKK